MDKLKQYVAASALGLTVLAFASPGEAQAPDPSFTVSRARANYACCIVGEQYAERGWCNMEIYRSTPSCAPGRIDEDTSK